MDSCRCNYSCLNPPPAIIEMLISLSLFFYLLAEGIVQYRILHDVRWWYDVLILILKIYHVLVTLGLLSYHKWQTAFVVLSSWFFCSVEHMQFQSEKKLSRVQTLVPIQKGSGRGENSRQPGPIAGSHTCYNFIQYNFSLFLDIYFQYNFVVYELGLSWDILLDNSCVSRCRKDV